MKVTLQFPRQTEANVKIDDSEGLVEVEPVFFQATAKAPLAYVTVKSDDGSHELKYVLKVAGATGKVDTEARKSVTSTFDSKAEAGGSDRSDPDTDSRLSIGRGDLGDG